MNLPRSNGLIRFGAFELDLRARELRKDGRSTGLPEQSIMVLDMLLGRPGELILREEIRSRLWPNDTIVEFDHSINTAVRKLRLALGESADNPQYIETLARRGYRWIGSAEALESQEPKPGLPNPPAAPEPSPLFDGNLTGKKVSHYRVLEVLGGGGMGVVYKAEDLKLGRRVALKFLPDELAKDPVALQRLEREARAASALNHPNVCTIYEITEHVGRPFIVMELLEGGTLREQIAEQTTEHRRPILDKQIDLGLQISDALAAAHAHGIIHRDIKPANIFVTRTGVAKILDFGVAKLSQHVTLDEEHSRRDVCGEIRTADRIDSVLPNDLSLTRSGLTMGTAGYMSPEQVRGDALDSRTDLFSFGLVLYEMVTGRAAFGALTAPMMREAILHREPAPARNIIPDIPERLGQILRKALEKDRLKRYQTAAEIRADLETLRRKAGPASRLRRGTVAAGVLALLTIATLIIWLAWRHTGTPASAPRGRITMAVLPFQNLTGDPDQEYLTDGLTEETIARLGALEGLGVIARTSVMGYKHGDKRLEQIGRELDVQYVLEGSVRRDRNRLRITAQLIQVKDHSHLWAQEYDRSLQDIIALQDDVAAGVTKEIQVRWAIELRNHPVHHQPANPEAHDAYFRGRYSLNQRTDAELQNALGYFRAAVAADPDYALAYAGLADCYVLMLSNYDNSEEATVLQARTAAHQAISLDPGLGEPHAVLALIAQNHDWNWEESEREFKLAMAADPADPTAHFWYSNGLMVRGRFDEGFREIAIARRLDPMSLPIRTSEGAESYMARRYNDALGQLDRVLEIEPNFAYAYLYRGLSYEQKGMWKEALTDLETSKRLDDNSLSAATLGEAYALAGDKKRARQILEELQVRAKREHVSPLYPAIVHAGLGDKDLAFSELEAAVEERPTNVLGIKVSALFDPLRSDPRFADLIRKVGLPPN